MSQTKPGIAVQCPTCKADMLWDTKNTHRPFCSESCKNKDFIAWADEKNSLPGSPEHDELFSSEMGEPY